MESARRAIVEENGLADPCPWCHEGLANGQEVATCTTCQVAHHATCWDRELGCGTKGCFNAPLTRLDHAAPGEASSAAGRVRPPQKPGHMWCPGCGRSIPIGTEICDGCDAITSPDGIYRGPKKTHQEAVSSFVFGLIGLFLCGPIFAPLAWSRAQAAKEAIALDPRLKGNGLATAGQILAVIAFIGWAITLINQVSK